METKVNVLILGQGLAGSLLSFELLRRGRTVLVVDDGDSKAASRLAAGLVSPITGQRTALQWRVDELLNAAHASYDALHALLGRRFFFPTPLRRHYVDEAQRQRFRARMNQASYAPWLGPEFESGELGGIEIKGTRWLDCAGLVSAWRAHLNSLHALRDSPFNFDNLQFGSTVRYDDIEADYVVLCAGARAASEGPFNFLQFQPTKGELLTVRAKAAEEGHIRYATHFAIPLGQHHFRIGATYSREDLSPEISGDAGQDLESSARQMLGETTLLDHKAGIRPNILGHFPVLGPHPEIPKLLILNGFGSKGAFWAPFCAEVMANWMLHEKIIPEELSVNRFNSENRKGLSNLMN